MGALPHPFKEQELKKRDLENLARKQTRKIFREEKFRKIQTQSPIYTFPDEQKMRTKIQAKEYCAKINAKSASTFLKNQSTIEEDKSRNRGTLPHPSSYRSKTKMETRHKIAS